MDILGKKEIKRLRRIIDADKNNADKTHDENLRLRQTVLDLQWRLASAEQAAANLKREQTEADLFFVTAKIQKELLDGKGKNAPSIQPLLGQQSALQQQLSGMAVPVNSGLLSGLFGGAGRFGAL